MNSWEQIYYLICDVIVRLAVWCVTVQNIFWKLKIKMSRILYGCVASALSSHGEVVTHHTGGQVLFLLLFVFLSHLKYFVFNFFWDSSYILCSISSLFPSVWFSFSVMALMMPAAACAICLKHFSFIFLFNFNCFSNFILFILY